MFFFFFQQKCFLLVIRNVSTHRFVSISMAHHMPTLHLLVYYGIVGKVTFIFQNMQSKAKENFTKLSVG